jgi:hypothetical protein
LPLSLVHGLRCAAAIAGTAVLFATAANIRALVVVNVGCTVCCLKRCCRSQARRLVDDHNVLVLIQAAQTADTS